MEFFSATNFLLKKNDRRWSTQFLKFVIRILSTLPVDPSSLVDQEDKLQYINSSLIISIKSYNHSFPKGQ